MTDYYLRATRSALARKLVTTVGLPVPSELERAAGAWRERPLAGRIVCLGSSEGAELAALASDIVAAAGAEVVASVGNIAEGEAIRPHALVFDASGIRSPAGLTQLYAFFHPLVRSLRRCGRVLVLGRPVGVESSAPAAAAAQALDGFVRSLAKELGRKGITAHLLRVEQGAELRLTGPMRFLLSEHSAYVDGQAITISRLARDASRHRLMAPLEDKVALVTGAAQGIGAAITAILAREGARVICLDTASASGALEETARRVTGEVLELDITRHDAPAEIVRYLNANHGGVDVIVHNAGITRDRTLGRMSLEQWEQVLRVNLEALIRIDEAVLGHVMRDSGRVVCLSSISGMAGNAGQTNYAASKAGIMGYVAARSRELADRGITVNAVAPGFIETRMTEAMPVALRQFGRRLNSLSQGGLPQDVAEAVAFLASPGAAGITGSVLRVCGQSLIGA